MKYMTCRELVDVDRLAKPIKKKNVCAYARVSTLDDDSHLSFAQQVKTYTEHILGNPAWNFCGVYSDEGKSGTNVKGRDQFQQMIEVAKSKKIDLILTKSISRFARNTVDCLTILRDLRSWGVEVWFENDNISSMDSKIEFLISVLSGMAEEEARGTSTNVRWNVQKKFKQGNLYTVNGRFFGYDSDGKGNLAVNESQAVAVRMIFQMYVEGKKKSEIIAWLESNYYSTAEGNAKWPEFSITSILKNEKYTGTAILQKTIRPSFKSKVRKKNNGELPMYIVENSHEAIVTQEIFDQAQELRLERTRKYSRKADGENPGTVSSKTIYSSFFYCPQCGRHFFHKTDNRGKPCESEILLCASNRSKRICESDRLFVDVVDQEIIDQVNRIIENKAWFLKSLEQAIIGDKAVVAAKAEIERTKAKIEALEARLIPLASSPEEIDKQSLGTVYEQIAQAQIEKVKRENDLILKNNSDSFLLRIKEILRPFKARISSIDEFPFKDFFSQIIVKDRDHLLFLIGNRKDFENADHDQPTILDRQIEYQIRKTKHLAHYGILYF
jgi:DNA invertase Pin-like site-specific DNA recombinase